MSGVDTDGKAYCLTYPWIQTNAGRSESRRPRQKNDCTVRTVAVVLGLDYDVAYDLLKDAGRTSSRGFQFSAWIGAQPWARKMSFPAVAGERRMNPARFVLQFPVGRYVCKVAKHVFAVCNGVVFDEAENSPDRCIYTAWAIEKSQILASAGNGKSGAVGVMPKRYLVASGWDHIFEGFGQRECRFVFDTASARIVYMDLMHNDWRAATRAQIADVEDSLKTANEDALLQPAEWGLHCLDVLPAWASGQAGQTVASLELQ